MHSLCGTNPLYLREPFSVFTAGITFIQTNSREANVLNRRAAESAFVYFAPRIFSLSVCLWMSIHTSFIQSTACTWAFCKGKTFAHLMRHRLTVAGTMKDFFFFVVVPCVLYLFVCLLFCFFSATILLYKVCLKTNTEYLGYKERNTVIIQSIVLILGTPRGVLIKDSKSFSWQI